MKIAICDDSMNDIKIIKDFCIRSNVSTNLEIHTFNNSCDLQQSYANGKYYDIILLDVEMPGIDGIHLGKYIKSIDSKAIIIFISSYPQYAVESYDCSAFYYILKPCTQEKIKAILKHAIDTLEMQRKTLIVYKRNTPISINLNDIYYIECLRKHVIFHFADDQIEIVSTLAEIYAQCNKFGFLQIHQGYIVNMNKIKNIEDRFVILDNNIKVEISVRKKSETLLAYANFLEGKI